jgi:hypothetical protein
MRTAHAFTVPVLVHSANILMQLWNKILAKFLSIEVPRRTWKNPFCP